MQGIAHAILQKCTKRRKLLLFLYNGQMFLKEKFYVFSTGAVLRLRTKNRGLLPARRQPTTRTKSVKKTKEKPSFFGVIEILTFDSGGV